jgi:uracil-DNA glycosylase
MSESEVAARPAPKLDPSWAEPLADMFAGPVMTGLREFLLAEKVNGKRIFPKGSEYFRALDLTPLNQVRVVILGQDPYHGEGQAHGLCFSVQRGVRPPPSLQNIYKELKADCGIDPPRHGNLTHWGEQGVLLLPPRIRAADGKNSPTLWSRWLRSRTGRSYSSSGALMRRKKPRS